MRALIAFAILLAATSLSAAVVQPLGVGFQLLIPAAGSTPGLNGTFFRSDISILNLAAHDQVVNLQWLPQPGLSVPNPVLVTLKASTGVRSADFVRDYLNQTGLGAILVTAAVNSDGTGIDQTARLFVSSRIWTPQPGTNGTTSQDLPAIPASQLNTPAAAIFSMGGADDPPSYRTNVGIVNLDPVHAQTFYILHFIQDPVNAITVTLPPFSMQQVSLGTIVPGEQIQIQNITQTNKSNFWTAYGSTINNVTGDAWDELAVVDTTP
ncbi:MAG TPA: hypothetical protein VGR95_05045 [Thermoanaerobaculia bacterium]|jgi:hypothetical protein|nr:hypothetical protein [Thermoanaerobaculia bacterium]